jgi:hypothetical protein
MTYIEELQARQAQLAAAAERLHPKPTLGTFEDEHFRLPNYAVEGPGPVIGADLIGSYQAAGVVEPTEQAFAAALHLQPAMARQLLDVVKSIEGPTYSLGTRPVPAASPTLNCSALITLWRPSKRWGRSAELSRTSWPPISTSYRAPHSTC